MQVCVLSGQLLSYYSDVCMHVASRLTVIPSAMQAGAQTPPLYGSKQNVPPNKFYYVNLANFLFNPKDPNYNAPAAWNGKLSIVFMLKDGPAFSGAQAYITQQPVSPTSENPQTAGR